MNEEIVKLELKGMTCYIKQSYLDENPSLKTITEASEFIRQAPDFMRHCHRTDGPALTSTRDTKNEIWIIEGVPLFPSHINPVTGSTNEADSKTIKSLLHKATYNGNILEVLCK